MISFVDTVQLEKVLDRIATCSGLVAQIHARCYSRVINLCTGPYHDVLDPPTRTQPAR